MKHVTSTLLALCWLLLPGVPIVASAHADPASAPVLAQDDEEEEKEKPDKRPEIKALIDELDDHVGDRGKKDVEAVVVIEKLAEEFPESGPKDRKAIVKALGKCMKAKRKPTRDGVQDRTLHERTAEALGTMGPESVKTLKQWIDHKSFAKNTPVRVKMVLSLGKTRDEDAVDTLVDLLPNHDAEIQAAAATGLSFFTHLKAKERKAIFKEVLDEITRVKNIIDIDQVDPIKRKRYDVISRPMIRTLQELSGNSEIQDPQKFLSWRNDHKNALSDEDRK